MTEDDRQAEEFAENWLDAENEKNRKNVEQRLLRSLKSYDFSGDTWSQMSFCEFRYLIMEGFRGGQQCESARRGMAALSRNELPDNRAAEKYAQYEIVWSTINQAPPLGSNQDMVRINEDKRIAFLAGCEHKEKRLASERARYREFLKSVRGKIKYFDWSQIHTINDAIRAFDAVFHEARMSIDAQTGELLREDK